MIMREGLILVYKVMDDIHEEAERGIVFTYVGCLGMQG